MSSKAISTHTIFLIGAITLFLLFTIISLWNWLHLVGADATEASCTAKLLNYCERWKLRGEDPDDWNEIEPSGCQEFDITKPSSIDDCKMI